MEGMDTFMKHEGAQLWRDFQLFMQNIDQNDEFWYTGKVATLWLTANLSWVPSLYQEIH